MYLKHIEDEQTEALKKQVLPKETITDSFLIPGIMKASKKILIEALKREIEIYKAFPKRGRMDIKTFNTKNHKTCFMGQAFNVTNSAFSDTDLRDYRKAVGTFKHGEWGDATLLEIWGGDHFDSHRDMVKGVFSYCRGTRETLPPLKFEVMPLFQNKKSGKTQHDSLDRDKYFEKWIIEINGQLTSIYGRKPLKIPLDKKWEEVFEKDWISYQKGHF